MRLIGSNDSKKLEAVIPAGFTGIFRKTQRLLRPMIRQVGAPNLNFRFGSMLSSTSIRSNLKLVRETKLKKEK